MAIKAVKGESACRDALRRYWPINLQDVAITILDHENSSESPTRRSNVNFNGTYDNGCMQINDVHFGTKGWTKYEDIYNPDFNAQIAYEIYKSRGPRAWYAVYGVLWR